MPFIQKKSSASIPSSDIEPKPFPAAKSQNDFIEQMPNSEKLMPHERAIYGALPGISQSGFGKVLEKFNNSWVGKALTILDVGAEAIERTVGLARQYLDGDTIDDWKAAWYAGAVTYDTARVPYPVFRDEKDPRTGVTKKVIERYVIPLDLPGSSQGLATARNSIERYVSQGMSYREAADLAREELYNGLGALAIRGQLQDTFGHVFADPLNLIGGVVKSPLKLAQARRIKAFDKAIGSADELLKLAKAAETAGDAAKAANYTSAALAVSKGELKVIGKLDRIAIALGGGNIFEPTVFAQKLEKIPVLKGFLLSKEAKASEAINIFANNLATRVIAPNADKANGVEEAFAAMQRIAKGGLGEELGHIVATPMGRGLVALSNGDAAFLDALHSQYKAIEAERGLLATLSTALDAGPTRLLSDIGKDPSAVLKGIANSQVPEISALAQSGQLTADTLKVMAEKLKNLPYNQEMFFAHLMDEMETMAMRQAVVQFGVKERGVVTRWSQAVKSAETMAFLRINPAYMIQNVVNNDITMMARGVFNLMDDATIDAFWKTQGFVPHRLSEGFHVGSELGQDVLGGASKELQAALSGGHVGAPEKISKFFKDVSLGKIDMGELSRKLESKASRRAFTSGYMEYMRQYAKHPKVQDFIDGASLEALNVADAGLTRELNNALKSADGSVTKLDEILKGNLNLTPDSVFDDVEKALGYKLNDAVGVEALEHIRQGLPEAIKGNKLDAFMFGVRQKVDAHVDDLFNQHVAELTENIKNKTILNAPEMWYDSLGKAQMMWMDGEIEHAIRIGPLMDAIRAEKDPKKLNSLMRVQFDDDAKHFLRYEKRMNAVLDGLEQGWRALREQATTQKKAFDLPSIAEVRQSFNKTRGAWKDFFEYRSKVYSEWFGADPKTRPPFETVQAELDSRYAKVSNVEALASQQADEATALMIRNPQVERAFRVYRGQIAELRVTLRQDVADFRLRLMDMPAEQRPKEWAIFWNDRQEKLNNIRFAEQATTAAMQGDPRAIKLTEASAFQPSPPAEILEEIGPAISDAFIADVHKVVPDFMPIDLITEQANYGRVQPALDAILEGARRQASKPPLRLDKLPPELRGKVLAALESAKTQFGTNKLQATQFAEFRRDAALLNYNRRTNFDNWISNVFPYAFWTTGSMQQWALSALDKPTVLTNYFRTKKMLETAGAPQEGLPSRFQDNIRIKLPYAPEWMGDQFIDPLRFLFPIEKFAQPIEQMEKVGQTVDGRAERLLAAQLQEGKISQADFDEAMTHSGDLWSSAISQAQSNDDSLKFDAWDFASMVSSPHAPLVWAYNAATGHPENNPSFSPLTRTVRNAATLMGVDDWSNHPYNLEAKVRRSLGLPAFDKWDDYRIDRAISNMSVTGKYTLDELSDAMRISSMVQQGQITPEQAKAQSEAYRQGVANANREYTGGGYGALSMFLGLTLKSYPPGENSLRQLQDDFAAAYEKDHAADQSFDKYLAAHPEMDQEAALEAWEKKNPKLAKDANALTDFFDSHPEYETRLALFDKPEERLRRFLVDDFWGRYMELPTLTKNELKDQLGGDFAAFIDKETRSYDSVTSEQMAMWLKFMGGKQVGILTADQDLLGELFSGQLQLTAPETAWRAQSYYDTRSQQFPDYYAQQNEYYRVGANKKQVLRDNPELKMYWDWRRDFMQKNPDIVPYITEDEKAIAKAKNTRRNPDLAVPTVQELNISGSARALMQDYFSSGEMPPALEQYLETLAETRGLSVEQVRGMLGL